MRILITGGAGFIGSHLAEACLTRGDHVTVIDDLSTGTLENLAHLQRDAAVSAMLRTVISNVIETEPLDSLVRDSDVVFHLAAAVGVKYILDNPLASMTTNIDGTESVLDSCNRHGKKVVIASTSEVYGKHTHAPLKETDNIVYGPSTTVRWSYAATKLVDEFMALAYHRTKRLPVVVTRLFNTIGPRQSGRYGMVVPRLVTQALRDHPLTVYGNGSQTRTFTHVSDVVKSLLLLGDCSEANGEVVNIGGREEISIYDLAVLIVSLTGSSSEIKLVPYEEAYETGFEDMARRVPCTAKLKKFTGYVPRTSLEETLRDIIFFMKS